MRDCEFCLMYERQGERVVVRYVGDVNCPDAYVGLRDDPDAVLLDVRTSADQCGVRLRRASRSHADRASEPSPRMTTFSGGYYERSLRGADA
jgi:hypothetical protein